MKRYCKQCFEQVEAKSFCRICREPICLIRYGWIHNLTQTFLGYKNGKVHSAVPGGKPIKAKGKAKVRK